MTRLPRNFFMRPAPQPADIGESNQRQSDFYWGWEDAEDGRTPRKPDNDDYMRGYCANPRAFRWPK